jgi:hypothetical protein
MSTRSSFPPRKTRLSMDAITIPDESVEEFVRFLKAKLEPEDFAELKEMLGQSKQSGDDDPDMTMDEPPDFKGKPKPGGTMVAADASSDASQKRFNQMFPDCARIKVWL